MSENNLHNTVMAELNAAAESLMRAVEAVRRGDTLAAEQILKEAEERAARATRALQDNRRD
jgi:hypothetical protein